MVGRIIVSAIALLASLVVATAASAESAHDSKITLRGNPAFSGTVESTSKHCIEGRKVRLLRVAKGRDKVLGETFTDENGAWFIAAPVKAGKVYYAKVLRGAATNGQFCAGDRSNRLKP